ncbi:MAG: carbamoyltransferase family protein, partial [bacterium]
VRLVFKPAWPGSEKESLMIILGINPGYDSTAALVIDGRIGAVVEEERLSRVKMHLGFPRRAIREVLRLSQVQPADVDCVTFSFIDYLTAHPLITRFLLQDKGCPFDPENPLRPAKLLQALVRTARPRDLLPSAVAPSKRSRYRRNINLYMAELRSLGIPAEQLVPVDHHLAHAASAYYSSGFDECLVITADGCGDGHSLTVSIGKDGKLTRIRVCPDTVSAGILYASVTAFLGFRAHRHEGKITGLAGYGDPGKCYEYFIPCLKLTDDKRSLACDFSDQSWLKALSHLRRLWSGRYFRNYMMNVYDSYFQQHLAAFSREDVAAAAQRRLEDVFVEYLSPIVKETKLDKLALAGGVFSNVKLNQRLFEMDGVREIFIHPNMGDGGNALGSAMLTYNKRGGPPQGGPTPSWALTDVYFGPEFSDQEIEGELKLRGLKYRYCANIEAVIAEQVARHQVVGRFHGRMEYGPRALGNRSILANPTDASINAVLNKRLRRTEFMPFAPSVLSEDAQEYFDLSAGNLRAAEYMTITCNIRHNKRKLIPAVCHVDGTARPNIVRESVNPSYYKILREFKRRTGLGVIVNTSFNIHEEPIVCTPADACTAFDQNSVDVLAIGNFLVERE